MVKNFVIKKGDQLAFTITFTSATPATAMEFGVKKNYSDEIYTIIKSLDDGITKLSDNKYQVIVPSSDTNRLDIENYVFDLRLKIGGVIKTPLSGKLMVKQTVFED